MRIQALALLAALALPLPMLADSITYTYTGNDFTANDSPYTTSDSVTGEFTLSAPLADSLGTPTSLVSIDPASFSFSDGVQTLSSTNATIILSIGTNTSGAITQWIIYVDEDLSEGLGTIDTDSAFGISEDSASNGLGGAVDFNEFSPGTWTSATAVTPEPASLMLVATGLAGALTLGRRRFKRS